jgi:hypothetical protein
VFGIRGLLGELELGQNSLTGLERRAERGDPPLQLFRAESLRATAL